MSDSSRAGLGDRLRAYKSASPAEESSRKRIIEFVLTNADCFERSNTNGHLTASAWIVSRDYSHTLLTHHRKLDKWIQCGGHADGSTDLAAVAMNEAQEESGMNSLQLVNEDIFDVDVHLIPVYKTIAEQYHYDIRYLFTADAVSSPFWIVESIVLAWVELENVRKYNAD